MLGISTKRRVSACPAESRVCQSIGNSLWITGGQRMEFNSAAIATAGFGVDAVAFEPPRRKRRRGREKRDQ